MLKYRVLPFQQKILDTSDCPKCNAKADLRLVPRGDLLVITLECPKCKNAQFSGLTSFGALKNKKLIKKLENWHDNTTDAALRRKIRKQIKVLEDETQRKELGL